MMKAGDGQLLGTAAECDDSVLLNMGETAWRIADAAAGTVVFGSQAAASSTKWAANAPFLAPKLCCKPPFGTPPPNPRNTDFGGRLEADQIHQTACTRDSVLKLCPMHNGRRIFWTQSGTSRHSLTFCFRNACAAWS